MEENVFFSAADNIPPTISQGKFGMASGIRKPNALSDSSNSVKKLKPGLGNIPSFGFKKPAPLGFKKQPTRSVASIDDLTTNNNDTNGKHRSNSVPSNKKPSQPLKDLNEFYDFGDEGDDWYPEPEYLRDFSIRDLKDYIISSPIEINLEEEDELIPRIVEDDFTWTDRADNSYQEQDDDDDDENYPEIETIPSGYATRSCVENQVWVCDLVYEKDDPSISEPPILKYDEASHSAFISDYLSAINMLPSISSEDDSTDVSNDEDSHEI